MTSSSGSSGSSGSGNGSGSGSTDRQAAVGRKMFHLRPCQDQVELSFEFQVTRK